MAYNPNRDSGIAPARSFIEIKATDFPAEAVEEFDFVPTQRYFAQLVYNVGSGSIGGGGSISGFTGGEIETLHKLIEKSNVLLALSDVSVETFELELSLADPKNANITDENSVMAVQIDSNSNRYYLVEDTYNIDNDPNTEYLLNVPGYVCGIECYTWFNENTVSSVTERFIPKMTYLPYKADDTAEAELNTKDYPNGKTIIYLNYTEFKAITELPKPYNILKIHTLKMPSKQ